MKRKTIERRRGKTGNYALRRNEQLRGSFRLTSPFRYEEGYDGLSLEEFRKYKKGEYQAKGGLPVQKRNIKLNINEK